MRDPKRIRNFCNQLADVWETMPDIRFGQLMETVWLKMDIPAFYAEDDVMLGAIKRAGYLMAHNYIPTANNSHEEVRK